jgi:hypothetical protein
MKNPFPFKISEGTVVEFIARNFDTNTAVLATDDRFEKFRSLARQDEEIAAAKEYHELTGASLHESHLAATFAKGITEPLS